MESQGEEDRDYVPALLQRLVAALPPLRPPGEAIARAARDSSGSPATPISCSLRPSHRSRSAAEDDAIGYWERCLEMGDAPARYLSAERRRARSSPGSRSPSYTSAAASIERARELLEWCIAEHPDFIGVIDPYASVLLRSGVDRPRRSSTRHRGPLPSLPPAARFVLAGALYRHGAMAAAETEYRAVLRARPSSAQVRVQLAETLLGQRRYAEAATPGGGRPRGRRVRTAGQPLELWGLIAAGDLAAAHAARDRAGRVGVPEAQLKMFTAWLAWPMVPRSFPPCRSWPPRCSA